MKNLINKITKLAIIPALAGSLYGCDIVNIKTKTLETNPKNIEAIIEKEKGDAVIINADKIVMRTYKEIDPEIYPERKFYLKILNAVMMTWTAINNLTDAVN